MAEKVSNHEDHVSAYEALNSMLEKNSSLTEEQQELVAKDFVAFLKIYLDGGNRE